MKDKDESRASIGSGPIVKPTHMLQDACESSANTKTVQPKPTKEDFCVVESFAVTATLSCVAKTLGGHVISIDHVGNRHKHRSEVTQIDATRADSVDVLMAMEKCRK